MDTHTPANIRFWVAFSHISGIGPKRFTKLLDHFKNLEHAWNASHTELSASGIGATVAQSIIQARSTIEPERLLEKVYQHGLSIVTLQSPNYPSSLTSIADPPWILYVKGSTQLAEMSSSIAVVGSRKMTPYGAQVTEDIAAKLCAHNITVISGLALGTDACAQRMCVARNHPTIAVLAHGLDRIYPSAHTSLAKEIIASGGSVISEYPPGVPSYKSHFPYRNRIISGLAMGTVIVEAAQNSGSLITAQHALEQGREIFAVPGSIYSPQSQGTNTLIAEGAAAVTKPEDIISAVHTDVIAVSESQVITPKDEDEAVLVACLSFTPRHIDDIIKDATLDVQKIHSILVTMEIDGLVKNCGGGNYALVR